MIRRFLLALSLLLAAPLAAQEPAPLPGVPEPAAHFGFEPGTDRRLANWTELSAYYDLLARTSPRVVIDTLGPTTLGEPFVMLTITSPENHARLAELRAIQLKLADPRTIAGAAEPNTPAISSAAALDQLLDPSAVLSE